MKHLAEIMLHTFPGVLALHCIISVSERAIACMSKGLGKEEFKGGMEGKF